MTWVQEKHQKSSRARKKSRPLSREPKTQGDRNPQPQANKNPSKNQRMIMPGRDLQKGSILTLPGKELLPMMVSLDLLTVRQAARLLGVSTKRVYQYVEQGRLESLRLGPRQMRIPRPSLEQLVRQAVMIQRQRLGLPPEP
jgi:excisionase family DNA binding protein